MAQFPAGYPPELKKYGYPPPFPAGYPPEQYEKYGWPPSFSQVNHNHSPSNNQKQLASSASITSYPCIFPWGPGSYIPIAGNVTNSGFNVNGSGTQTSGDVKVSNYSSKH